MSKLIKRKDGSYSPRGLWDNIRENIGSGKKPTKEMLAQEKKIKRKMEDGGSIPERYRNMGFSRVGQKKDSTNEGKKWMVLAKKGDQYKVVHGGYKGMQDFKQHGSEQRKENFWNRMGGRDSAKATDPFSPLYWHKRLGTWQKGGELPEKLSFEDWKSKYGLSESPDYNLKRAWELGYIPDKKGHLPTVDNQTLTFLKAKNHPTLSKELDWYNSPQGKSFKQKYKIDSTGIYYKYVPKGQDGLKTPDTKSWYQSLIENLNPFTWFDDEEAPAPVVKEQPKLIEGEKPSTKFPREILLWQAHKESGGFRPDIVSGKLLSPAKAKGLTQVTDDGLKYYHHITKTKPGSIDLTKPEDSVKVQMALMDDHYNSQYATKGNPTEQVRRAKALAFYNLGRSGTIKILNKSKAGGKDIYRSLDWLEDLPLETRDYIQKVLLHKIPKYNEQFHRDTTNSAYPKLFGYQKGGIITDPRGQWAHPGKVTRIPSDTITMQGVKQPLLGVSDKGEQKVMIPNKNYKFADAKYVTEYPLKEKGGIMNKLGDTSKNRRDLLKVGVQIPQSTLYPLPFAKGGLMQGRSGIYIKPENRGKFTAWAKSKGMGVQEAASKVMSNKEEYSPTIVKRANFAKNAAGWNKGQGGSMAMNYNLGNMNIEPKSYAQGGGIDNPGFKALPDFVQAKIRANMEQGGVMKYRMGGRTKFNKMC